MRKLIPPSGQEAHQINPKMANGFLLVLMVWLVLITATFENKDPDYAATIRHTFCAAFCAPQTIVH